MKNIARFSAVLIALLSIGMHAGIVAIPLLAGYKFIMLFIAFLLLFASMLL
ncbi:hypothetical protein [Cardinium endosymbiont of Oedothorax gibbosus]|uniref:hypothetical protein n=1 Tax=Cardinium endosymbiont of Oedothorax gibbosus TaxID=931101 RepID=UPI00202458E3|nr:hypothetical protein [Cardinium endosymbiont of Oedothorax gibbosus]